MLPIAILAGGLGTRLGPMTETVPKALVPVGNRPFIDHQLLLLRSHGFTRAIICVSYLGEMIERHVDSGSAFGLEVTYSYDGPERIGTAGALKRALPQLGERFFAVYGDSYLDCDYKAIKSAFVSSGRAALMTVYENCGALMPSNVLFRNGFIEQYDKAHPLPEMQHVDYGLSVFHRDALADVPTDRSTDLAEVFQRLLKRQQLAAYQVASRFYEIGTPEGVTDTLAFLRTVGLL